MPTMNLFSDGVNASVPFAHLRGFRQQLHEQIARLSAVRRARQSCHSWSFGADSFAMRSARRNILERSWRR